MANNLSKRDDPLPPDVQGALDALRARFKQAHAQYGHATGALCCDRLHGTRSHDHEACEEVVFGWLNCDAELSNTYFFRLQKADTPSFLFLAHLHCYLEIMAGETCSIMAKLIGIGRRLKADGIDWAKRQAQDLIRCHRDMVADWVRAACDGEDVDLGSNSWRAPLLLAMAPAGRMPFDPGRDWERMDAADTREALEEFVDRYVRRLESGIEDEAGAAYLEAAKQRKPAVKTIAATSTPQALEREASERQKALDEIAQNRAGATMRYKQAALALGLEEDTLRKYARENRDGLEPVGVHRITIASLNNYMAKRRHKRDR